MSFGFIWLGVDPQPIKIVAKTAIEINLVVFSLFNTGLHSGKMQPIV